MQDKEPRDFELTFPRRGTNVGNVVKNFQEEGSTSELAERLEKERDFELTFPRPVSPAEKKEMTVVDWEDESSNSK